METAGCKLGAGDSARSLILEVLESGDASGVNLQEPHSARRLEGFTLRLIPALSLPFSFSITLLCLIVAHASAEVVVVD
jgi:hypothetical protein